MIQSINIHNFKGFRSESLYMAPLTLLTGLNSTGKSSCFQAVLAALYHNRGPNAYNLLANLDFSYNTCRNKNVNAKEIGISVKFDKAKELGIILTEDSILSKTEPWTCDLEDTIFYLSANRLAYKQNMESFSENIKVGIEGEYLFSSFEAEKSKSLMPALVKDKDSETLSAQLNWWLTYILGVKLELQTERVAYQDIKVIYKSDDLPQLSPKHLGVGVSYLAKTLIMCLRAQAGDVLMIESPEIHLHPAAQAKLGEFFTYIAKAGIQLLIETHCENLINKIRYEIFKGHYPANDALLYYKGGVTDEFQCLHFLDNGQFDNPFPEGFYDATLMELLEMN